MAFFHSPNIVTDGLVLCLDAGDKNSYPGTESELYIKAATPEITIQRTDNNNDSVIDFQGSAGNIGAKIAHSGTANNLVFHTFTGSTLKERLTITGGSAGTKISGSALSTGSFGSIHAPDKLHLGDGFSSAIGTEKFTISASSGASMLLRTGGGDGTVVFSTAATTYWTIGRDNSDNSFGILNSGGALGSNNAFTIKNSTKYVGIGTNAPTKELTVEGTISGSTGLYIGDSTNYISGSTGDLAISGKLSAAVKSFVIKTPDDKKLEYGSLEGEENAVFCRGKLENHYIIDLPKEWKWLIDPDTITVQLTSIGKHQNLYVDRINDNEIFINDSGMFNSRNRIKCYYIVHAERIDVERIKNE